MTTLLEVTHTTNPILHSELTDTLTKCHDALSFLSESSAAFSSQHPSEQALLGMSHLMECVISALDYHIKNAA